MSELDNVLFWRSELVKQLDEALAHLPRRYALHIATSVLNLEDLEKLVRAQQGKK